MPMGPTAATSALVAQTPRRVVREVLTLVERVRNPAGALLFVSGDLAARMGELADGLSDAALGFPLVIAPGAGVANERHELERDHAAAIAVWHGGSAHTESIPEDASLAAVAASWRQPEAPTAVVLLGRPQTLPIGDLDQIVEASGCANIIGAGTVGPLEPLALDRRGNVSQGHGVALVLRGLCPPRISVSRASRLITKSLRITDCDGPVVLELDGEPALEVLSRTATDPNQNRLLLVALLNGDGSAHEESDYVLRGIRGVDPTRGGVIVSDEIHRGGRLALALRDAEAARMSLQQAVRQARRETAGAAPCFGLYFNCAGRGSALYGAPDVDVRVLRTTFPELPVAGMQSSFELAPLGGRIRLQLFTGVFALFTSPS